MAVCGNAILLSEALEGRNSHFSGNLDTDFLLLNQLIPTQLHRSRLQIDGLC